MPNNDLVKEIEGQFARLRKMGNDHGRERLVVIASEELARRGGGDAARRRKARRAAVQLVREMVAA